MPIFFNLRKIQISHDCRRYIHHAHVHSSTFCSYCLHTKSPAMIPKIPSFHIPRRREEADESQLKVGGVRVLGGIFSLHDRLKIFERFVGDIPNVFQYFPSETDIKKFFKYIIGDEDFAKSLVSEKKLIELMETVNFLLASKELSFCFVKFSWRTCHLVPDTCMGLSFFTGNIYG